MRARQHYGLARQLAPAAQLGQHALGRGRRDGRGPPRRQVEPRHRSRVQVRRRHSGHEQRDRQRRERLGLHCTRQLVRHDGAQARPEQRVGLVLRLAAPLKRMVMS